MNPQGVNLLIEPSGGLAGDMLLAALLDLGDAFVLGDLEALARELVPGECTLDLREVERGGFRALALDVHTAESHHAPHRHLPELTQEVNAKITFVPHLVPMTRGLLAG